MKSSFRSRLFRLFLLFSLIPAFLVAMAGYFLASDRNIITRESTSAGTPEVVSFYNSYLSDQIRRSLLTHSEGSTPLDRLDFVIELRDPKQPDNFEAKGIDSAAASNVIRAAMSREGGVVQENRQYYQFASATAGNGRLLIGGFLFDSTYGGMMKTVQTESSRISSARVLGASYILFVGVVFIIFALIALLLAAYFSSRYSRSLAAPLLQLGQASRRIAEGDFNQQVTPGGDAEIAALIENFNLMARRLQTTTARLAQSERVAAWRQVARRFAHELKNPLQPIMISLYRIEKKLKESGQYDQMGEPLKAASEELQHLTELADRFSHLAKLPEPAIESVNLNDFLTSIAELYKDLLAGFDFRVELCDGPVTASIDPVYFREALHNLLKNAADASNPGGTITLKLFLTEIGPAIEVRDFGSGMSKAVVASAAIPYFTTKEKGTGLGLAIVERTVNEVGGALRIESAEGAGTTITIMLPDSKADETENPHS